MGRNGKIMRFWSVLLLLLLAAAGCGRETAAVEIGSWREISRCVPSLSVTENAAGCGLYVQGLNGGDDIGANLRLQRLEGGNWRTVRLWYGLSGEGELDFADRCWLNEAGSYRLSAEVWVDELAPVVLSTELKLREEPPRRPNGEELAYQTTSLFAFDLPEWELAPEIWEEILATARTEADRYYNAAPGLLLRSDDDEIVLGLAELERLATALESGEIGQLAFALPGGRVCFLRYGQSLRNLASNIKYGSDSDDAGLRISLATTEGGGWNFSLSEAAGGAELQLTDDGLTNDVLVYGRLYGESLAAWERSAVRVPSERTETPLYANLAVLYKEDNGDRPVAAADVVYGVNGDTESAAYARILTRSCGEYRVAETAEYAEGRWYGDYLTYLAGRGVIEPADFAPERALLRGELAELLYRLAGEPEQYAQSVYKRVAGAKGSTVREISAAGEHAKAVNWVVNRSIMTGFADGSFRAEENVTRQELLVMLWRYVEWTGTCLPHHREDIYYYDRGRIGGFAREAVSAFSEAGLAPREDWRRLAPMKLVNQAEAAKLVALVNQSVLNGLERFVLK